MYKLIVSKLVSLNSPKKTQQQMERRKRKKKKSFKKSDGDSSGDTPPAKRIRELTANEGSMANPLEDLEKAETGGRARGTGQGGGEVEGGKGTEKCIGDHIGDQWRCDEHGVGKDLNFQNGLILRDLRDENRTGK